MMRIFRAYQAQNGDKGAVTLKATPDERRRYGLRAGSWALWIILMLACGYYGHVIGQQFFPEISDRAAYEPARNYWLSDVHYVFKKNPLPARIEIETDEAEEDGITPDELLSSDEDAALDDEREDTASDHDALRLRVRQALKEVQGEEQ